MHLSYLSPTKYRVTFSPDELAKGLVAKVRKACTYKDKRVQFGLRKLKANRWMEYHAKEHAIAEMEAKETVCLLEYSGVGNDFAVPSGLVHLLVNQFHATTDGRPEPSLSVPMRWVVEPPTLRPYQEEARKELLAAQHAAISLPTGSGKSLLAVYLIRTLGKKTVIMAPSINIADQLFADFTRYLGTKNVGKYYDGKKQPEKKVVVAVAASLTKVEPGTVNWDLLASAEVFIADEAHRTPAATLEKVCFGLLSSAPHRFFLSATQLREDGLDLLLKAITGPVVFDMTLRDGVDAGFLARPRFKMVELESTRNFESSDALEMNRVHLMHNPEVLQLAARIINSAVSVLSHQVLVLIDEVQQFNVLAPLLKHPLEFAHGPLGKEANVAEKYRESNPTYLVAQFNQGKFPILVGTSCISEGTDVRPVKTMVFLKGGKSEVDVRQSLGRCTRRVEGKSECNVVDFDIINVDILHRHAQTRRKIYNETYPPVETLRFR